LAPEEASSWAAEVEEEQPHDDMMVAIALQNLANLRHYMPPTERIAQSFELWKANCLTYDADPSGTVYLYEDSEDSDDFRVKDWLGTFSGSWQGADILHCPGNLSVEEAIAWGRARSPRVFVATRDGGYYTAGSAVARNVLPWPENIDLSPRTDRKEGLEWMDRTEDDDPIEWDVSVGPYVPPHTTTEAFLSQFRMTLEEDPGINLQSIKRPPDHIRVPGNPVAVIRLEARTKDGAEQMATKLVLPLFSRALRNTVAIGPFGWTMSVNAQPAED
jgi:hypothetical protein